MKQQSCKLGGATLMVALFGSALSATAGSLTPPPGPIQPTNRVQINQQFGGLPIQISQSGSYVLTGNIEAPKGYTGNGIEIGATDVTLDLNGFSIIGVATSANGIASGNTQSKISVRNGTVRGWGSHGVHLAGDDGGNLVDNVKAINNLNTGIVVNGGAIIRCFASNNGFNGIMGSGDTTISHCTARENVPNGFCLVGGQNFVIDCVAIRNTNYGIETILAGGDSVIRNTCRSNGSSSRGSGGGINVFFDSFVQGNHLVGNLPNGIVSGLGNIIIQNVVTGSDFNYAVNPGNNGVGPIGTAATSTSPWANITD